MSTHNIPFSIQKRKKITINYPKSAAVGIFQGTQELVRNSRGRRAISVRATEVLLYCGHGYFPLRCAGWGWGGEGVSLGGLK